VEYKSDLIDLTGIYQYKQLYKYSELEMVNFNVQRISALSSLSLRVNWNVSFVPTSVLSLYYLGNLIPGLKIVYFDVLDREKFRSTFSWAAFRKFLCNIVINGEMKLPHAVICGISDMSFSERKPVNSDSDSDESLSWELVSQRDSLLLVNSINNGILKNRKLALDLLEFLDSCRPDYVGINQWNDIITSKIRTRNVPGMGQFDIDGLEGDQQQEVLKLSSKILGFATATVLLLSVAFATAVFNKTMFYRELAGAGVYDMRKSGVFFEEEDLGSSTF